MFNNIHLITCIAGLFAIVTVSFGIFFSTKKKKKIDLEMIRHKKKIREEQKIAKKMKSTLDWMDIQSISSDGVVLQRGKNKKYVKGVVITPINITIQSEQRKVYMIRVLANALDKMKFTIYWKFIKTSPDVGYQMSNYTQYMENEGNPRIAKLLELQIAKLDWFKDNFKEMTFLALVQSDEKHIDKKFSQLRQGLSSVFDIREMRCIDYEHLVSQEFENDTVNEYMFTQLLLPDAFSAQKINEDKEVIENEA